ncbi:MAG: hypothetical protein GX657_05955, partial [Chloroflexi bacterium]|nr:hypothetical protein [Chloroflexota bacterium]
SGELLAVLAGQADGGFQSLTYHRAVNAPGLLVFELSADAQAAGLLEHRGIVEVWRRDADAGIDWHRDYTGLILRRRWQYQHTNRVTVYAPGILWLLGTRHVLYPAATSNRSMFLSSRAETIAKTLVEHNAGSAATLAGGRLREGAIAGLGVEPDQGRGNRLDWYCAYANVLETLQGLAAVGGGDFDLVQVGDGAAYEFRWHEGQLGADRSAKVVFGLDYGNMGRPVLDDNRIDERNVVAALGQGEGADREVVLRTAGDADVEGTTDARNEATTAALEALADRRLVEWRGVQAFNFEALQTPASLYGLHYHLGDLVTARYGDISLVRKVVGVTIELRADGRETVTPEFGAP